eukprot:1145712-Pelagomonas_calceolata.AAC.3
MALAKLKNSKASKEETHHRPPSTSSYLMWAGSRTLLCAGSSEKERTQLHGSEKGCAMDQKTPLKNGLQTHTGAGLQLPWRALQGRREGKGCCLADLQKDMDGKFYAPKKYKQTTQHLVG